MSIIPLRSPWLALRYAPGAITATILTPARLTDTTAPAGSGAACLSALDPGMAAGMATRGVGAMDTQVIMAGVAATATDTAEVTDTTDTAAATTALVLPLMAVGVQGSG